MADRIPLVVDSSNFRIEEAPAGDSIDLNALDLKNTTVTGVSTFSGSTNGNLVRVTNTGTGNAVLIEDSANPDGTPVVVGSAGSVGLGTTSPQFGLDVQGDFKVGFGSTEAIRVVYGRSPNLHVGLGNTYTGTGASASHASNRPGAGGTTGSSESVALFFAGNAECSIAYGHSTGIYPGQAESWFEGTNYLQMRARNVELYAYDWCRYRAGTTQGHIFYAGGTGGGVSNTSERMRIMPNGRVGIGSTIPQAAFDVRGSIDIENNITCGGALSKGSGSFRIPHPTLEGKDLVHSFVEGPRVDLIYRGTATLSGGTATVDLDAESGMTAGTWEALCRDPQVWVTSNDGWTLCRGSVSGATLTITAQDSSATDSVNWLVVAERQDENIKGADWTDSEGRPVLEPDSE